MKYQKLILFEQIFEKILFLLILLFSLIVLNHFFGIQLILLTAARTFCMPLGSFNFRVDLKQS